MTPLGTIAQIRRYPVKSMQGELLDQCALSPGGLVGDRGWAVRDLETQKICSAKQYWKLLLCSARYLDDPTTNEFAHVEITLPDGSTLRSGDIGIANTRLSNYLDRAVSLSPPQRAGNYYDVGPYHLLTSASLQALGALAPNSRIDPRRFRPNIYLQTPAGVRGFIEFQWTGSALNVGDMPMTAGDPVPRCGMTASPQPDLPKDPDVIRTLIENVDKKLGIYLSTEHAGTIRAGDAVVLNH